MPLATSHVSVDDEWEKELDLLEQELDEWGAGGAVVAAAAAAASAVAVAATAAVAATVASAAVNSPREKRRGGMRRGGDSGARGTGGPPVKRVSDFLDELRLSQYREVFAREGVDEVWEDLAHLGFRDLVTMGLKSAHARRVCAHAAAVCWELQRREERQGTVEAPPSSSPGIVGRGAGRDGLEESKQQQQRRRRRRQQAQAGAAAAEKLLRGNLFVVGTKVEALFRQGGAWYPGEVSRVRTDPQLGHLYDIAYDDGDCETCVHPALVRLRVQDDDVYLIPDLISPDLCKLLLSDVFQIEDAAALTALRSASGDVFAAARAQLASALETQQAEARDRRRELERELQRKGRSLSRGQ